MLRLAVELQKLGHTVEIFVSAFNAENSYPELLKDLNVTVVSHPLGKKMPRWLTPLETVEKQTGSPKTVETHGQSSLREWMRKNIGRQFYTIPYDLPSMINIGKKIPKGFDIINNHNYPSEWAALAAKKRLHAPIVWMCNEPPFWFFVPELRKGLRKVNWPVYDILDKVAVDYIDEILVLSHIAGGYVKQAYNRSSFVVRSGIDAEPFGKATGESFRERYGLERDFVMLQVGNLELNKRQHEAIRALAILCRRFSNIKLVFDGGGRTDELSGLCRRLDVADKVLFLHSKSDQELAEVYAACDVFVFPAQITWGLAVVEAMAAKKPVVVSKKCGVAEIIQNNINGLLVSHANPEDLAQKVEFLLNNPTTRKELGENAQNYVKNNLSWERYAQRMEVAFERAKRNCP